MSAALDRIMKALGSVEIDEQVELLTAVLQDASEENVIEALKATHPSLLDTSE